MKWYSGTLAETGPEWYFWDFQWYSLNGTVAALNGIEWYCGPLSGVSSGIELLFPGVALKWYSQALNGTVATLNGIEWYCGPLSGVSSGIELLFPGI